MSRLELHQKVGAIAWSVYLISTIVLAGAAAAEWRWWAAFVVTLLAAAPPSTYALKREAERKELATAARGIALRTERTDFGGGPGAFEIPTIG